MHYKGIQTNVKIQDVLGEKVNIFGGHSIGRSKQESTCVLFRTVSEISTLYSTRTVDKKEI
jgi:hypothetical protein